MSSRRVLAISVVSLVFSLAILGVGVRNYYKHQKIVREASHCSTIHMPKGGCPEGWLKNQDFFTEKDGSRISACTAPTDAPVETCIDEIGPGEGFSLKFTVGTPEWPINQAAKP